MARSKLYGPQSEASKQWHTDRLRYCQAVLAGAVFEKKRKYERRGSRSYPAPAWCWGFPHLDVYNRELFSTRRDAVNQAIWQVNVRDSFPMLASFVEEIADWDFPDVDMARSLAIKVLPSTTPYLIVQYRESVRSSRKFLDTNNQLRGWSLGDRHF